MNKRKYIVRMTEYWVSIDKLYDKLIPMCREEARSEHRAMGVSSTIKKVNKELQIMKARASSATREFNRMIYKNKSHHQDVDQIDVLE